MSHLVEDIPTDENISGITVAISLDEVLNEDERNVVFKAQYNQSQCAAKRYIQGSVAKEASLLR